VVKQYIKSVTEQGIFAVLDAKLDRL